MSTLNNSTNEMIGQFFVFELKDEKLTNISIGLESLDDANSFIDTMKEGMYYKSISPDIILIAMEVKSISN